MTDSSSPLDAASTRIRDTAKWLTVSLAVIAGAILAGTQLTNIGDLDSSSPRFWPAILAGGLAAVGTAVILWAAVVIATTPLSSLAILAEDEMLAAGSTKISRLYPARQRALTDPTLLRQFADVKDLKTAYMAAINARATAFDSEVDAEMKGGAVAQQDKDVKALNGRVQFLDGTVRNVLAVASYYTLTARWKRSAVATGAGALLATAGVVLFVWAANPPAVAKASEASPDIVAAVTTSHLHLTPSGISALRSEAGAACVASKSLNVTVLGETDAGPDVLLDESGCNQIRIVLTSAWGYLSEKSSKGR